MKIKIRPKTQQYEFEKCFYEALLQKRPHFGEAMIALAEIYTRLGEYEKGLYLDQKITELYPEDAVAHYNMACSYSLTDQLDLAIEALLRAIELGYTDFKYIFKDPDLNKLRDDKRFKAIMPQLWGSKKTATLPD